MKLHDPVTSKEPMHITEKFWIQTICHPNLTRLKYIAQTGNIDHIHLASSQNRYAHSLGTGFRVSLLLPERVDRSDREKAIFAGLCHDVGHGPYSHSLEHFILPGLGLRNWKHEELSVVLGRQIYDSLDDPSFSFTHFDEILHSGSGDSANDIFQLISSKTTGFDCDRYDYMVRDSWHAGQVLDVNWGRLTQGLEFRPDTLGKKYCQVLHKDAVPELARFLAVRYSMFETLYHNPQTTGIELLVSDIFLEADQFSRFSQKIQELDYFLSIDDSILRSFRKYKQKSKKFADLYERLERRQFYEHVQTLDFSTPEMAAASKEERTARIGRAEKEILALLHPVVPPEAVGFVHSDIDESKDVNLAQTVYEATPGNPASLQVVADNADLAGLFGNRKSFKVGVFVKQPDAVEFVADTLNKWVQKRSKLETSSTAN